MGKCIAILGEKGQHNTVRKSEEKRISTMVLKKILKDITEKVNFLSLLSLHLWWVKRGPL